MPVLRWIHLSDIHTKSSEDKFSKYNRDIVLNALLKDIDDFKTQYSDFQELNFAFITGDLAFSGGGIRSWG